MDSTSSTKGKIVEERIYFFIEVVIVFLGIGILLIVFPQMIYQLISSENAIILGPLFYFIKAIVLLAAIPLLLYFSTYLLELQGEDKPEKKPFSASKNHLKLFSIKKKNAKYQLLYGLLLLFLLFIPLDCITYIIVPDMLKFQGEALTSNNSDLYLTQNYGIFIISVVIIQISVAIYEETLTRGFVTKRGADHFNKISAVIISSLYFGLMHFAYIINPISRNYPLGPFIWFVQAIFVGIILGLFIIKKKWLFPLIMAHALNNIISAHAVWNYLQGNEFLLVFVYLYFPLLIVSVMLLIWQFSRVKESVSNGLKDLKKFFQKDGKTEQNTGDVIVRILVDIIIGLLIFGVGFLFV